MEIWRYRVLGSVAALALLLLLALFQSFTLNRMAEDAPPMLGGIDDWPGAENDLRVIGIARFAVSEHNKKTNALLELEKVVKVKKQLVSGTAYYITIQVSEGGAKKLYEAKMWVRLWLDSNPKQLVEFKPAEDKLCSLLHIMSAFLPWLNRAGCNEHK